MNLYLFLNLTYSTYIDPNCMPANNKAPQYGPMLQGYSYPMISDGQNENSKNNSYPANKDCEFCHTKSCRIICKDKKNTDRELINFIRSMAEKIKESPKINVDTPPKTYSRSEEPVQSEPAPVTVFKTTFKTLTIDIPKETCKDDCDVKKKKGKVHDYSDEGPYCDDNCQRKKKKRSISDYSDENSECGETCQRKRKKSRKPKYSEESSEECDYECKVEKKRKKKRRKPKNYKEENSCEDCFDNPKTFKQMSGTFETPRSASKEGLPKIDVTVTRMLEITKTVDRPFTLFREITSTRTIEKPMINYKITTFTETSTSLKEVTVTATLEPPETVPPYIHPRVRNSNPESEPKNTPTEQHPPQIQTVTISTSKIESIKTNSITQESIKTVTLTVSPDLSTSSTLPSISTSVMIVTQTVTEPLKTLSTSSIIITSLYTIAAPPTIISTSIITTTVQQETVSIPSVIVSTSIVTRTVQQDTVQQETVSIPPTIISTSIVTTTVQKESVQKESVQKDSVQKDSVDRPPAITLKDKTVAQNVITKKKIDCENLPSCLAIRQGHFKFNVKSSRNKITKAIPRGCELIEQTGSSKPRMICKFVNVSNSTGNHQAPRNGKRPKKTVTQTFYKTEGVSDEYENTVTKTLFEE